MVAYLVNEAIIHNVEMHDEFRLRTPPLLEAHGGRFAMRGNEVDGSVPGLRRISVMEFDTLEEARAWATVAGQEPELVELRAMRDTASTVTTTILEGYTPGG